MLELVINYDLEYIKVWLFLVVTKICCFQMVICDLRNNPLNLENDKLINSKEVLASNYAKNKVFGCFKLLAMEQKGYAENNLDVSLAITYKFKPILWFLNTEHEYDLFGIQLLSVLFKSSCSFWRSQNYRIEGEQIQWTEKCTNNEDKTYLILEKEKKKKHKEVGCAVCPCLLNLEHYWIWGWTRSASLCMYKCSLPVISNVKIFKKWITHPGWPHHNPGIHLLNGFLHYKCYSFKC